MKKKLHWASVIRVITYQVNDDQDIVQRLHSNKMYDPEKFQYFRSIGRLTGVKVSIIKRLGRVRGKGDTHDYVPYACHYKPLLNTNRT